MPQDYREVGDETTAWVNVMPLPNHQPDWERNSGNNFATDFTWAGTKELIAGASAAILATLLF